MSTMEKRALAKARNDARKMLEAMTEANERTRIADERVRALEMENDTLRLIIKHVLRRESQIRMSVAELEAADAEPNLRIIDDERTNTLIVKFDGAEDLIEFPSFPQDLISKARD